MHQSLSIATSVILSAGASMLLLHTFPPHSGPSGQPAAGTRPASSPDPRLEQMIADQTALREELCELRELCVQQQSARTDLTPAALSAASAAQVASAVPEAEERQASAAKLLDELLASGDGVRDALLWQRAREAGLSEELLRLLAERVEQDPQDPARRVELGLGYLARIEEVGQSALAGQYATQADQAFDAALELDPNHWQARFTKAMALSFWPPAFGKKAAAIQELETLRAQQGGLRIEPHFRETYLLLGNLYRELGEANKARAVWEEGLGFFPGDGELSAQMAWTGAD